MSTVKIIFGVGLAVPFLAVLFRAYDFFGYTLWWALGHISLLILLCSRLNPNLSQLAVDTLHKAGFLQTLISLAAAVSQLSRLSEQNAIAASFQSVLAPMAASLLPHVMGVAAGHFISTRYFQVGATIEESIFSRLLEDAEAARDVIRSLYGEREKSLRNQIRMLDEQLAHSFRV